MTWDYRIVRLKGGSLSLCEVYFDDGVPRGFCDATAAGESLEELKHDLEIMSEALTKPVLDESECGESSLAREEKP